MSFTIIDNNYVPPPQDITAPTSLDSAIADWLCDHPDCATPDAWLMDANARATIADWWLA